MKNVLLVLVVLCFSLAMVSCAKTYSKIVNSNVTANPVFFQTFCQLIWMSTLLIKATIFEFFQHDNQLSIV